MLKEGLIPSLEGGEGVVVPRTYRSWVGRARCGSKLGYGGINTVSRERAVSEMTEAPDSPARKFIGLRTAVNRVMIHTAIEYELLVVVWRSFGKSTVPSLDAECGFVNLISA